MAFADQTIVWQNAAGVEIPLTADEGIELRRGAVGLEFPPVIYDLADRPGDGSILKGQRYGSRRVVVPLLLRADPIRDLLSFTAELFSGTGRLIFSTGDRARTLRDVYYEAGLEGDEATSVTGDTWRMIVASFIALDPYWYDGTESLALGPPEADIDYDAAVDYDAEIPYDGAAAGITAGQSYDDPIDYDATVPYDGGAIVDFDLDSELGVWPTITVRGPATYVQIIHLATGEVIETLEGVSIPDGRDLLIVTRPEDRTVLLAGAEAWDRVTAETTASMMLRPGVLTDLRDEDGVQVRDDLGRVILIEGMPDRLAVAVRGTTAASWVRIAWEERWRTP